MVTSGSLLGNYAPQMEEPYAIESSLAKEATGGSSALANTLLNQYWYERQQREGQYADRLSNQMQFGQQQLHAQLMDTYLKSMPDLAKANLLPATSNILQSQVPGLDAGGLQYASDQAAANQQATNAGNYGRFLGGAGQYGLTIPMPALSNMTGIPGLTPGTPTAVQAQAEANKGRLGAAAISAAGRAAAAGPQWSYTAAPDDTGGTMTTKGRGGPPTGYGISVPPASGATPPAASGSSASAAPAPKAPGPNQATPPPPNFHKADDTTALAVHQALQNSKATNPQAYNDAVGGYVGNRPNAFVSGNGDVVVRGKSGNMIPMGNIAKKQQ